MQIKRKIGLGMILLSILLLFTASVTFIPMARIEKTIDFTIINPELPDLSLPSDLPIYLLKEIRNLKLAYPQWIWRDDPQYVILSLQPITKNPSFQKQTLESPVKYHVYLEARLELSVVRMETGSSMIEAVDENQATQFSWKIRAEKSGRMSGNLWLFVNITDSQSGKTWQLTRFAIPLQIESKDIFGLSLPLIRNFALVGFLIAFSAGLVLIFFKQRNVKK